MATVPTTFQLPFVRHEKASQNDAYSFFFDKSSIDFNYIAGQYVRVTIDKDYEDERGKSRYFSAASAPSSQELMITTRIIKSPFKMQLKALTPGEMVKFTGPLGQFVVDEEDTRPHVFIAGGIGITPFHSIVTQAAYKKLNTVFTLFCSYSTVEDIVYHDEFTRIAEEYKNFIYVPTVTHPEESKTLWNGEKGRLNDQMIHKYISDIDAAVYFIAGPATMVDALKRIITDMGVQEDRIKAENFPGY